MNIKTKSIVFVFVVLIIILAVSPRSINNVYDSILGRLLLIGIVIFFSMNNLTLGLLAALAIISATNQFTSFVESMENGSTVGEDYVLQTVLTNNAVKEQPNITMNQIEEKLKKKYKLTKPEQGKINLDKINKLRMSEDQNMISDQRYSFLKNVDDLVVPDAPVTPILPVDPVAPLDPVTPIDPINPVDPVDPVAPLDPVDPVAPLDPVAPVAPVPQPTEVNNENILKTSLRKINALKKPEQRAAALKKLNRLKQQANAGVGSNAIIPKDSNSIPVNPDSMKSGEVSAFTMGMFNKSILDNFTSYAPV